MPVSVQPHSINVSQEVLDDLHGRLRNVRWPEEVPGTGWTRGVDLKFMKDLVEYWLEEYDWRKQAIVFRCDGPSGTGSKVDSKPWFDVNAR